MYRAPTLLSRRIRHQRADRPYAPLGDAALLERDDVISWRRCRIYGIGSVRGAMTFAPKKAFSTSAIDRRSSPCCKRNQTDFTRGTFRVPVTSSTSPSTVMNRAWRMNLFGDTVENI
jgi:excinuclease ABC subunit B